MNKRNLFVLGLSFLLFVGNIWLLNEHKNLKSISSQNEDKLIGSRATLDSLHVRYDNLDETIAAIEDDNGKLLKTEYSEEQQAIKDVFDRYYELSKEMIKAKLNNEESKFKALKNDLSKVINVGKYSDYDFFRGSNWTMVYYDKIPDFTKTDIPYGVIGIIDDSGRAVALLRVLYNDTEKMFQLISVDTTLEWLASTDAYPTGEMEVGETSVDKKEGE